MPVRFKILDPSAVLPVRKTTGSAGYDLHALHGCEIGPYRSVVVHTGLAVELPPFMEMQIRSRSGLAASGLVVANSPGTIDSDFRGEIRIILQNNAAKYQYIEAGDRVAQAVFSYYLTPDLELAEELSVTSRGSDGMGSTGR